MRNHYDFVLQFRHSSRGRGEVLFLSTQAKRRSHSLASKSNKRGSEGMALSIGDPYKQRPQAAHSQVGFCRSAIFSAPCSRNRLRHTGGVLRGAWPGSSGVSCVKNIETDVCFHLEYSEGRNVAGAAGGGWASRDYDAVAKELRIWGPPTHIFTVLRRHCRGPHCLLWFHANDSEQAGVVDRPDCPQVDHWGRAWGDTWAFLSEGVLSNGDDVQRESEQPPRKLGE